MQHVDTRGITAGNKTALSQWAGPASASPWRQTPASSDRRRQRFFDAIATVVRQTALGPERKSGKVLGKYDPFLTFYCAIVVVFSVLAMVGGAQAGDKANHLGTSADIEGWIAGLANQNGANCCSDADGVRPQAVDWDIGKNHYRVKFRDRWIDVPESAVVRGPNHLGHAVVWIYEEPLLDDAFEDTPYVRCFLPGPAS